MSLPHETVPVSWLLSWADARATAPSVEAVLDELHRQSPVAALEVDPSGTVAAWARGLERSSVRELLGALAVLDVVTPVPLGRPPRGGRHWSLTR